MLIALTFLKLVALSMAALSLPAFILGLLYELALADVIDAHAFEIVNNALLMTGPFGTLMDWHHNLYWNVAESLGLVTEGPFFQTRQNSIVFFAIHGTNLALGVLSLRAIWRARDDMAVSVTPVVRSVFPYVQRGASWVLNAVTAGVLGNYAWKLIEG